MPALWSPKDLAVRFAPYIEELHDVFAMHGLHYGAPEDMPDLAAKLAAPGTLNEEVSSLVRSMVLREGGSVPRTDLLEILATAVAGSQMDAAGEELHQPVRQLLAFLHGALHRPWNEPPGEERLQNSPAGEMRAQAARELREAAAQLEAEAQIAPVIPGPDKEPAVPAARATVIPFGRARAIFSKLAREDEGDLIDESARPEFERAAGLAMPAAKPEQSVRGKNNKAVAAEIAAVKAPHAVPVPAQVSSAAPASPSALAAEQSALQRNSGQLSHGSVRSAGGPPEFDDEPPLPAMLRFTRFALVSGVAAVVLIVAVLGITLHAGAGPRHVVDASQEPGPPLPQIHPVPAATSHSESASNSKPDPAITSAKTDSHFDDDYVAPPYSTAVPQSASSSPQSATAQIASEVPAKPAVTVRPRDPDAIAAGDPRVHVTEVALEEPPLHPHVPGAVMAMNLVAAPKPDYPMLAKLAHVDGPVVIHAEIGRSGAVVDTDVISGHHLLRHAAEDAVRHWRYRPYQVDGKAVPVSTTVTVRFRH